MYIRSSWLTAFSLALEVVFSFTHSIYCLPRYSRLSIFYLISNFIHLALNGFDLFFFYSLICSFCAFLSFWALVLDGFVLLRRNFLSYQCFPGNSMFGFLFGWHAFCCYFNMAIYEVLIFFFRNKFFRHLLKSVELVFKRYCIFIANIFIVKQRPTIVCGNSCLCRILM